MIDPQRPWGADMYRRDLHQALQDDVEGLVDFVHGILAQPETPMARQLRPATRQAVSLLLRGLFGGSDHLDASLWHRIGSTLAMHGTLRHAVRNAFETGTRRVWTYVLQRTAAMSTPSNVSAHILVELWSRLEALREPALSQLLAGYDERRRRNNAGATGLTRRWWSPCCTASTTTPPSSFSSPRSGM